MVHSNLNVAFDLNVSVVPSPGNISAAKNTMELAFKAAIINVNLDWPRRARNLLCVRLARVVASADNTVHQIAGDSIQSNMYLAANVGRRGFNIRIGADHARIIAQNVAAARNSNLIWLRGRYLGIAGPRATADGNVGVFANICGPFILIHQAAADNGVHMNAFAFQFDVGVAGYVAASAAAIDIYDGFFVFKLHLQNQMRVAGNIVLPVAATENVYRGLHHIGAGTIGGAFPFWCIDHRGLCQVKRMAVCKNKSRKRRSAIRLCVLLLGECQGQIFNCEISL
ncbi:MAG: hypothetical protein ACLUV1_04905 [Evtepia gabavorous]